MEDVQTTEGQASESVSGASQPSQNAGQDVGNTGSNQSQAETEMISRLEYNKARESERKLRTELARREKILEGAKNGIKLHEDLSKSTPEKLQKIMAILQAQEEHAQEDDSWLNELSDPVANRFREEAKVRRELLSRINQLEQKLNTTESWTVGQNERALENTFTNFLKQNNIFPELSEEVEQTPKYQMIQSYVLGKLAAKCGGNPKLASVEDLQEVLNEAKMGISEIGKQETIQKVQPVVPPSGSRSGQIPKSEKVTSEDVTNLWSSFRQGVGW